MDVAAAFKNFFEARKTGRKVGYPQFKSKKRSRQPIYLANDKFRVGDHWIDVPKLARMYSYIVCQRSDLLHKLMPVSIFYRKPSAL
jgi:putative transposase